MKFRLPFQVTKICRQTLVMFCSPFGQTSLPLVPKVRSTGFILFHCSNCIVSPPLRKRLMPQELLREDQPAVISDDAVLFVTVSVNQQVNVPLVSALNAGRL